MPTASRRYDASEPPVFASAGSTIDLIARKRGLASILQSALEHEAGSRLSEGELRARKRQLARQVVLGLVGDRNGRLAASVSNTCSCTPSSSCSTCSCSACGSSRCSCCSGCHSSSSLSCSCCSRGASSESCCCSDCYQQLKGDGVRRPSSSSAPIPPLSANWLTGNHNGSPPTGTPPRGDSFPSPASDLYAVSAPSPPPSEGSIGSVRRTMDAGLDFSLDPVGPTAEGASHQLQLVATGHLASRAFIDELDALTKGYTWEEGSTEGVSLLPDAVIEQLLRGVPVVGPNMASGLVESPTTLLERGPSFSPLGPAAAGGEDSTNHQLLEAIHARLVEIQAQIQHRPQHNGEHQGPQIAFLQLERNTGSNAPVQGESSRDDATRPPPSLLGVKQTHEAETQVGHTATLVATVTQTSPMTEAERLALAVEESTHRGELQHEEEMALMVCVTIPFLLEDVPDRQPSMLESPPSASSTPPLPGGTCLDAGLLSLPPGRPPHHAALMDRTASRYADLSTSSTSSDAAEVEERASLQEAARLHSTSASTTTLQELKRQFLIDVNGERETDPVAIKADEPHPDSFRLAIHLQQTCFDASTGTRSDHHPRPHASTPQDTSFQLISRRHRVLSTAISQLETLHKALRETQGVLWCTTSESTEGARLARERDLIASEESRRRQEHVLRSTMVAAAMLEEGRGRLANVEHEGEERCTMWQLFSVAVTSAVTRHSARVSAEVEARNSQQLAAIQQESSLHLTSTIESFKTVVARLQKDLEESKLQCASLHSRLRKMLHMSGSVPSALLHAAPPSTPAINRRTDEPEMPIHERFARAHQQAQSAISIQLS